MATGDKETRVLAEGDGSDPESDASPTSAEMAAATQDQGHEALIGEQAAHNFLAPEGTQAMLLGGTPGEPLPNPRLNTAGMKY